MPTPEVLARTQTENSHVHTDTWLDAPRWGAHVCPVAHWPSGPGCRLGGRRPVRVGLCLLPGKEAKRDSLVSRAMTFPAASQTGLRAQVFPRVRVGRTPAGTSGETEAQLKEVPSSGHAARGLVLHAGGGSPGPCQPQASCAQCGGRGISAATTLLGSGPSQTSDRAATAGLEGRSAGTLWGHCSPGN